MKKMPIFGTHAHPRIPYTSTHTHVHVCTLAHTCAHPCTPATPHILADALNLINHMKLHVNGKMAEREKDREIERKNKEGTRVR